MGSFSQSNNTTLVVFQTTLFFILIFLSISLSSATISTPDDTNNYVVGSFNCRRCKVFIRADVANNGGVAPPPENQSSGNKKPKTVGLVVGLIILVFAVLAFLTWLCWKRPPPPPPLSPPPPPPPRFKFRRKLETYSFEYLNTVTRNFDKNNKIGGGSFGNVYKGTLSDETTRIAIKVLKFGSGIDDFKNEIDALGQADHPNLVKLFGYCVDLFIKILVYEYMENGSLEKWIFYTNPTRSLLTWPQRRHIIVGIAKGLVHLHDKCDDKILHRDLKPSNVVLDDDLNAKLCDFGLAKMMDKDQTSTSTAYAGTREYMAPEVKQDKKINEKVDVYSFGIVVLEILFGKRYCYLVRPGHERVKDNQLRKLINKNLSLEMRENANEIEKIGKLAVWCIHEKPEDRPSMSAVVLGIQCLNSISYHHKHKA